MTALTRAGLDFGDESRTGSAGVPLALASTVHRRVVINRERPRSTARSLGLSVELIGNLVSKLKKNGLPSRDRLILLSSTYPDRTPAEIASAFAVTVDHVHACIANEASLRKEEPLTSELWEDIEEDDLTPCQIASRAAEVRRRNDLVKASVPWGPEDRTHCGAPVRRRAPREWSGLRPRQEARPA